MKKNFMLFLTIIFIIPFTVLAYSDKVIVGGETVGIEVYSKGVYVVGFYKVNGDDIASSAGFKVGDVIVAVDDQKVNSINTLNSFIDEAKSYEFTVLRNKKEEKITLTLEKEDNLIKTGLYVKDRINGIGTLSYIDPKTRIFGSLGHEILESSSLTKFEIQNGQIYKAEVRAIRKSSNGNAGEKQATIDRSSEEGTINKNELTGIFGKYSSSLEDKAVYEVGTKEEIKKGEASIRTVIDEDKVETFQINILSIDESDDTKNILFEITDKRLLQKTGGVVQGMSGSPILQNEKIIGVVNYVIVSETNKGYGIFITTMLEEGDKLLN